MTLSTSLASCDRRVDVPATRPSACEVRPVDGTPTGSVANTGDFVRLLKAFRATGGTVPGEVMGELLKDRRCGDVVALAKLISTQRIFTFNWRGSFWIPLFQFDPLDFSVATGPRAVRSELPEVFDGWAVACWFAEPHPALGNRLPVDVVGIHLRSVRHAARDARARALA